jgi:hypothetical protein
MYVDLCVYVCTHVCIRIHVRVLSLYIWCTFLCSYLLLYKKFGLRFRSQFVFRIPLPPRIDFLCALSPFNTCSSPSSFPSFHNLFSDLLSTILPGIDKGVVQSVLSLGREGDIVLEKARRLRSVMNNAKNKSARISQQRRRVIWRET